MSEGFFNDKPPIKSERRLNQGESGVPKHPGGQGQPKSYRDPQKIFANGCAIMPVCAAAWLNVSD